MNKQMLLSSSGICASLRNTLATMAALFALAGCASVEQTYRMATSFNLQEATIASVQEAIAMRQLTCVQLTRMYLERIAAYDRQGPTLRAIITVNPKAMEQAAARHVGAGRGRGDAGRGDALQDGAPGRGRSPGSAARRT